MQNIVIFEQHPEDFGPLALTRPVYDLKCGTITLAERLIQQYPDANVTFITRDYLAPVYRQSLESRGIQAKVNDLSEITNKGALFIDGAVLALPGSNLPELGGKSGIAAINEVVNRDIEGNPSESRERIIYARLSSDQLCEIYNGKNAENLIEKMSSLGIEKVRHEGIRVITYLWHLIMSNSDALKVDYERIKGKVTNPGWIAKGVVFYNPNERIEYDGNQAINAIKDGKIPVLISDGVILEPGVELNFEEGPIILGKDVIVKPPTTIDGPFFADEGTLIDGAKIRECCSIGPACRIGGELEASIIHAYSNKHHDGFMGHSYIGEWVNWGAGTSNSDLKNDYSNVIVELSSGRKINSGQNKTIGCYFGDHSKTGLNTALNTGTVVGVMANVLMNQVTEDKYLPNFCLYYQGLIIPTAALKTAEIAMGRRNVKLTPEYRRMISHLSKRFKQETTELYKETKARVPLIQKDIENIVERVKKELGLSKKGIDMISRPIKESKQSNDQ